MEQQDCTFSKDEADAECARIATQKEAAKEEHNTSRIESGRLEVDDTALCRQKAPKRARIDTQFQCDGISPTIQNQKINGLTEAVPPGPQAHGKALRDLRVQELQKRVEQAARELRAATEGDPELVALEQRLGQLAAEEKKKPDKHFSSLAWRKACVALVVIFQFGVKKTARKMAQLLDDEGAPSSWEKQVVSLKNWRRAFAAGKLGDKEALLDNDLVLCTEDRRVRVASTGARPGPRRMFQELEQKLVEWMNESKMRDDRLTRAMVWDEALKLEPNMYGGRASEGWSVRMSRWYYKFIKIQGISIREKGSPPQDADRCGGTRGKAAAAQAGSDRRGSERRERERKRDRQTEEDQDSGAEVQNGGRGGDGNAKRAKRGREEDQDIGAEQVQNGGSRREGNSKRAKRHYLRCNEQQVGAEGL